MAASKRSGKVAVMLRGGPFSGYKVPLSTGWCPEDLKTLPFFVKGYLGQYDSAGKWHGILIGAIHEPNDNIILSWTE
jgi:hypothetical protein